MNPAPRPAPIPRSPTASASPCPSRRSCSRCCRRSSTRRSWPPPCRRSRATSAASATSAGSSPPTSSRRRRRCRSGASSATATAASCCSRSHSPSSSSPRRSARRRRTSPSWSALRMVQGAAAGGLMTLAMAAVGDLVSPRERGRYQGYIAAVFAVATVVGPLIGGVLVESASWRWVFLVNLPVGIAALAGLSLRLPAPPVERPARPLDALGAALLARRDQRVDAGLHLGRRPLRLGLGADPRADRRDDRLRGRPAPSRAARRRPDRPVPSAAHPRRSRSPAPGSSSATAALFSVTVFVPLLLQTATGATPTQAGLLLAPAMLGITVSTTLSGRSIARTGRYKRFPIAGLALMTAALACWRGSPPTQTAHDRRRAGRLRARLRDGHPGADHGGAEHRRAPRAGHRHGGDRLLPRARRRGRRRGPRRRLRRAGRLARLRRVRLRGWAA